MTRGWPPGCGVATGPPVAPGRGEGQRTPTTPPLLSALLPCSLAFLRPLRHLSVLPLRIFAFVRQFIQPLSLSFILSFPSFPLPFVFWTVFNFFLFAFLFLFACLSFSFFLYFRIFPPHLFQDPVLPPTLARAVDGPRLAGWAQPRRLPGSCLG